MFKAKKDEKRENGATIQTGKWGLWREVMQQDRLKMGTQYYTALELLGDMQGESVLDVGCGNGVYDGLMLDAGAEVVGYDASPDQISVAQKYTAGKSAVFVEGTPRTFATDQRFDKVVAVNSIAYARDKNEFERFFENTYRHLKDGGIFVAVNHNPEYKRFGAEHYQRIISPSEGGGTISVTFLNRDGQEVGTSEITDFQKSDYEESARKAGFRVFRWEPMRIHPEAQEEESEFWEGFLDDCPYIAFVAEK